MEATLASGHVIQIDENDAWLLDQHSWRAYLNHGKLRVVATIAGKPGQGQQVLRLSRLILGVPARRPVYHKNGDPLDLRRDNLHAGQHYVCPFSPEQLRALWAEENKTWQGIARRAADVAGWPRAPEREVVLVWLRKAGIPRPPQKLATRR